MMARYATNQVAPEEQVEASEATFGGATTRPSAGVTGQIGVWWMQGIWAWGIWSKEASSENELLCYGQCQWQIHLGGMGAHSDAM